MDIEKLKKEIELLKLAVESNEETFPLWESHTDPVVYARLLKEHEQVKNRIIELEKRIETL